MRNLLFFLSRIVSKIKYDNCKILPPRIFRTPAEGFPLEFCNGGEAKTRMMHVPDCQKVWRYINLFRHSTGTGQTGGQTDGRTDGFATTISRCACIALTRNNKTTSRKCRLPGGLFPNAGSSQYQRPKSHWHFFQLFKCYLFPVSVSTFYLLL